MEFTSIAGGLVGLGTIAGSAAAIWAVIEARKLRVETRSPDVLAYLERNDQGIRSIDLIVENVGAGPAYKVRLVAHKTYPESEITKLSQLALTSDEGISILPPRARRRYMLGSYESFGEDPRYYDLLYYAGDERKAGKLLQNPVVLRIKDFDGDMWPTNVERQAAKAIKEAMRKLASGSIEVKIEPTWRYREWMEQRESPAPDELDEGEFGSPKLGE